METTNVLGIFLGKGRIYCSIFAGNLQACKAFWMGTYTCIGHLKWELKHALDV